MSTHEQMSDLGSDPKSDIEAEAALPSSFMKFHDISMTSITGDQVSFADYEGKLAVVVNVASA